MRRGEALIGCASAGREGKGIGPSRRRDGALRRGRAPGRYEGRGKVGRGNAGVNIDDELAAQNILPVGPSASFLSTVMSTLT